MDFRLGSKRIKSIYKGSSYIPGICVNGRLWHGSPGKVTITSASDGTNLKTEGKVYYNLSEKYIPNETPSYVYVYSGGIVHSSHLPGARFYVLSGGVVNNVSVCSKWYDSVMGTNGRMQVYSGGIANDTVCNDGILQISSCGVANNVRLLSAGQLWLHGPAVANYVSLGGSSYVSMLNSDAVVNNVTVASGGTMVVVGISSIVNNAVISSGGSMFVVGNKGVANRPIISSGGYMSVGSGCFAADVKYIYGQKIEVKSGGSISWIF